MDLSTTYLGLTLPHPFIAGASPLADTLDSVKRVEDAGAAAIVMRSLFEEQIHLESLATHASTDTHADSYGEALSYFVDPEAFVIGPHDYLERLRRIKDTVDIPVIGSLNGYTPGGWLTYATAIEEAGADALELNLYYVAMDATESAADIEQRSIDMLTAVKQALRIPVAAKLSPFYTSLGHFARRLEAAGADGLVLFNRFFESDIDIDELEVVSHLVLSQSPELLLRLRWLAILSGTLESATLAVSGGVHTAVDAIKAVMAGAAAVQMVSALLEQGPGHLSILRREMAQWMEEKAYQSLAEMRGSMDMQHCPNPHLFARANYMHLLQTWNVS